MTNETKEALLKGTSMFIEPIEFTLKMSEIGLKKDIIKLSKCQVGSKVIINNQELGTIKNIRVVKVKDIDNKDCMMLGIPDSKSYFINWYNKQYGNYGDNPYIFLYELNKGEINEKN